VALFSRKNNSEDYLSNPDTVSRPVPIINALITGVVVALLVFGIFWAGKWIYDRINTPDNNTSSQNEQNNATEQSGSSQNNNSATDITASQPNNTNSSNSSGTNTGNSTNNSQQGQTPNGSSASGSADTPNKPIPSTGATPTEIPNTGPDPRYNY
jgi:cytoskeletal protein RodZ